MIRQRILIKTEQFQEASPTFRFETVSDSGDRILAKGQLRKNAASYLPTSSIQCAPSSPSNCLEWSSGHHSSTEATTNKVKPPPKKSTVFRLQTAVMHYYLFMDLRSQADPLSFQFVTCTVSLPLGEEMAMR